MKLYALLVGINAYPTAPLSQCVRDAEKIEDYLKSIEDRFEELHIVKLTDELATKQNVQDKIQTHLYQAADEDVVFFYYSGHGALEEAKGYFPDEHDGALDAMVCYAEAGLSAKDFLANKEIRYLLHKMPNAPHIITAIDSCHSGDIVRSVSDVEEDQGMIKRMAGMFPARDFNDFVFAGDDSVVLESGTSKTVQIPFKNSVHLAACLSSESSWEDSQGGVFTRYLLKLLKATDGNLTYLDISRWAKMSIADVTKKKQTPKISVQGEGKMTQYASWLNLNPDGVEFPKGIVTNNKVKGWLYSRGSLLGVKDGMDVRITLGDGEDDWELVKVKEVDIEHSVLDIPMKVVSEMDFEKTYPGTTEQTTYSKLKVYINDISVSHEVVAEIRSIIDADHAILEVSSGEADFFINNFNAMVYFSLPENEFQPLAEQIDLTKEMGITSVLQTQINAFVKWNHFYTLENPANDYNKSPIRVEAKLEDGEWLDVTNGLFDVDAKDERLGNGAFFQKYQMRVTNLTKDVLNVGVLTLNSDLSITSKPFDQSSVELQPHGKTGDTKEFYDHRENAVAGMTLDSYKEIYNWKEEWLYYKFIFNNFEDFTGSLKEGEFLQPALPHPLIIDRVTRGTGAPKMRGEGAFDEVEEVKKKWGTAITKIKLRNPTYNQLTGEVEEFLEEYVSKEELAPFIKELYFEDFFNGKGWEVRLKQNKDESSDKANQRATDSNVVRVLNKIYNAIRRRRFKRSKKGGPLVVAEGDSWFLFPKPGVRDTLDYIMRAYRLLSLADAGDDIADYVKNNELIEKVEKHKPDYVLISGGGNDVIGAEIASILHKNVQNGDIAEDFVDVNKFKIKVKFLEESYRTFFDKIRAAVPTCHIFTHGYDYIPGDREEKIIKNGWANRYMIDAGVNDSDHRDLIIHYLVDRFNDMMEGLGEEFDYIHFINNRNTIALDEWMDEIHPNNKGYEKVAGNFLRKMKMVDASLSLLS